MRFGKSVRVVEFKAENNVEVDYHEHNILPLLLEAMHFTGKDKNVNRYSNDVCDCIIEGKIAVRFYSNEREKKVLSELDRIIDREGYEWGILLHKQGIWLLNRDIYRGDEAFTSNRIVFTMPFTGNKDNRYIKYLSYDNLIGETKNAKFFADITEYRNKNFNSTNKAVGQHMVAHSNVFLTIMLRTNMIIHI